uniref:PDZ and LIM domain 5a n=1 Tax=Hucho hucho TaxID=62062 RepID=A0A4W5PR94_9TELE
TNHFCQVVTPVISWFINHLVNSIDFNTRLTDLGKAAKARIAVGDVVLSIDGISTDGMNHLEAQNKIKACAAHHPMGPGQKYQTIKGIGYIEFYHVPSHGDASKKRLMEDTEDWRPRSGTTQSRSFRILAQITGTEHPQESDAENKTKAKKVNTQVIGPKYTKLRDWHHGVSARTLNVLTLQ